MDKVLESKIRKVILKVTRLLMVLLVNPRGDNYIYLGVLIILFTIY